MCAALGETLAGAAAGEPHPGCRGPQPPRLPCARRVCSGPGNPHHLRPRHPGVVSWERDPAARGASYRGLPGDIARPPQGAFLASSPSRLQHYAPALPQLGWVPAGMRVPPPSKPISAGRRQGPPGRGALHSGRGVRWASGEHGEGPRGAAAGSGRCGLGADWGWAAGCVCSRWLEKQEPHGAGSRVPAASGAHSLGAGSPTPGQESWVAEVCTCLARRRGYCPWTRHLLGEGRVLQAGATGTALRSSSGQPPGVDDSRLVPPALLPWLGE